ncbi:MAG TPA: preprotein translocase subunit SecG [Anaerolineaceae bacterium]|nr:preprotein translocase subunit SecG [Anaerolineaceae bacterium]HQF61637.1 preprotein translocase subunit SecG [Anaerolineaceae bacterium]HQH84629.1 preprotein translocase subunit SecG [Anaerolineaceae bacterium]
MTTFFNIALIITSIALVVSVILQNKGVGLGSGLMGGGYDGDTVFTARRGIERTLFFVTIGLSVVFFILTLVTVILGN